jgi:hypothetical protein
MVTINGGTNPRIGALYTNSVAGATTTMLYDIDFAQDKLYYKTTKRWSLQVVGI